MFVLMDLMPFSLRKSAKSEDVNCHPLSTVMSFMSQVYYPLVGTLEPPGVFHGRSVVTEQEGQVVPGGKAAMTF